MKILKIALSILLPLVILLFPSVPVSADSGYVIRGQGYKVNHNHLRVEQTSPLTQYKFSEAGLMRTSKRPRYMAQIEYIREGECEAVAATPYRGEILYECPSGETFWSDVLISKELSSLLTVFKNREEEDDHLAAAASS